MSFTELFWKSEKKETTEPQSTPVVQPQDTTTQSVLPDFKLTPPTPVTNDISKNTEVLEAVQKISLDFDQSSSQFPLVNSFYLSTEKLKETVSDEATRIKIAFDTLKIVIPNFTKESLIAEFQKYLASISKEKETFNQEIIDFQKNNIDGTKTAIKDIENKNISLQQVIKDTNLQIETNNYQIKELQESIQASVNKVDVLNTAFEIAHKQQISKIETTISKLN